MSFKTPEIEIPKDNPFQNDLLGRQPFSDFLLRLIAESHKKSGPQTPSSGNSPGVVFGIDANWGKGKTTFLKMFEQELSIKKYKSILFNAWENDYVEQPLVSFICETRNIISNKKQSEKAYKALLVKGKKLAKSLWRQSSKFGISVVAEIVQGAKPVKGLVEGILEDFSEKVFKNYFEDKNTLKEFKRSLSVYVKSVSKDKPLIFIIDELDRCRPTYAIELLEVIKHVFSVENVVFVIAFDKTQLERSIKAIYGESFDSQEYLKKFYDILLHLPTPNFNQLIAKDIDDKDDVEVLNVIMSKLEPSTRDLLYYLQNVKIYFIFQGNFLKRKYFLYYYLLHLINNKTVKTDDANISNNLPLRWERFYDTFKVNNFGEYLRLVRYVAEKERKDLESLYDNYTDNFRRVKESYREFYNKYRYLFDHPNGQFKSEIDDFLNFTAKLPDEDK